MKLVCYTDACVKRLPPVMCLFCFWSGTGGDSGCERCGGQAIYFQKSAELQGVLAMAPRVAETIGR